MQGVSRLPEDEVATKDPPWLFHETTVLSVRELRMIPRSDPSSDAREIKVVRDAGTGRFVKPKEAIRRPKETVTETVRRPTKRK